MFYPKYAGFSCIARIFCPQTSFLLLQEAIMSDFSTRFRYFCLYFASEQPSFSTDKSAFKRDIANGLFPKIQELLKSPNS